LKKYKLLGTEQISAELTITGGETLNSAIHKLISSNWNKEEIPDQWKESVVVPVCNKDDKTDCSNYQAMSLLST
jgi:hypothetical protein